MKHMLLLASGLAAAAAAGAEIDVGRLPESGYADTEASTNVPFAFARAGVRDFEFDLCLCGTPSNNVQLAFGRDADSDGVLSAGETDMVVGWDCGEWRIACFTNGTVLASAPATTNEVKMEPARPPPASKAPRSGRERRRRVPGVRRVPRAVVLRSRLEHPAPHGTRGGLRV